MGYLYHSGAVKPWQATINTEIIVDIWQEVHWWQLSLVSLALSSNMGWTVPAWGSGCGFWLAQGPIAQK